MTSCGGKTVCSVFCALTFELSGRQRHGALGSKRKMGRRPCACCPVRHAVGAPLERRVRLHMRQKDLQSTTTRCHLNLDLNLRTQRWILAPARQTCKCYVNDFSWIRCWRHAGLMKRQSCIRSWSLTCVKDATKECQTETETRCAEERKTMHWLGWNL